MKHLYAVLLILAAASAATAQVFPPEGMNMPGLYNGFNNPPTVDALAGIQKVGGKFLVDTLLLTRTYRTTIFSASTAGDILPGTYNWLFTSGPPPTGYFNNKWCNTTVILDSVMGYTYLTSGGSDNFVTTAESTYYQVNFLDNGYSNSKAIWMSTASQPVPITSVLQSPSGGTVPASTPVTVTVNVSGTKPPDESFFVRWTTDNFATSTLAPVIGTNATIPGQTGGTQVKYYALSTLVADLSTDIDLKTLRYNNNGGAMYSYLVPSPVYTITASAGPHGSITPSGSVMDTAGHNQLFTFTPAAGYFVDSIIVDNAFKGDSGSYLFTNIQLNHTIRVVFTHNVAETFRVYMGIMQSTGKFRPDSGDIVSVNGDFNGFTPALDTLTDPDHDTIYTKTLTFRPGRSLSYKFWKTLRGGLAWEDDISNRAYVVPDVFSDTIPLAYFDGVFPAVDVTFRVNMAYQAFAGNFRADSGDVVTVRGSFDGFANTDTLHAPPGDSVFTGTFSVPGDQTIQYKFWKTTRNGVDYEQLPGGPFVNRSAALTLADTTLPAVYFGDENPARTTSIPLQKGWNMVSVPRTVADSSKDVLFPGSTSSAFTYTGSSYSIVSKLANSRGYWLKFGADTAVAMTGLVRSVDSIGVAAGWNMIGTVSTRVLTTAIAEIPPGITTSRYFAYGRGYQIADTLVPGAGYWIKAGSPGTLVLIGSGTPKEAVQRDLLASCDKVTFTDASGARQSLYLSQSAIAGTELPPAPFADAFDVRFAAGTFAVTTGAAGRHPVVISGAAYPVTVSWETHAAGNAVAAGGRTLPMRGRGSLTLADPATPVAILTGAAPARPASYALAQNYPNPFNPSTEIRFDLPEASGVELAVYNILGERVASILRGTLEAGTHAAAWNGLDDAGRPAASGVYFCALRATSTEHAGLSFAGVRKMLLVR